MKRRLALCAVICAVSVGIPFAQQDEMPAFHAAPPVKAEKLQPILTEKELAQEGMTHPAQIASYRAVARMSRAMYQMPCYCHCDRSHGHTSLRSCFETTHGANCGTCMAEALYTYKMSQKGWTAKMIRDGIIRGDYRSMDLQNPEPVL
jgi:hypothetical protein